jgi:hypothetical protein
MDKHITHPSVMLSSFCSGVSSPPIGTGVGVSTVSEDTYALSPKQHRSSAAKSGPYSRHRRMSLRTPMCGPDTKSGTFVRNQRLHLHNMVLVLAAVQRSLPRGILRPVDDDGKGVHGTAAPFAIELFDHVRNRLMPLVPRRVAHGLQHCGERRDLAAERAKECAQGSLAKEHFHDANRRVVFEVVEQLEQVPPAPRAQVYASQLLVTSENATAPRVLLVEPIEEWPCNADHGRPVIGGERIEDGCVHRAISPIFCSVRNYFLPSMSDCLPIAWRSVEAITDSIGVLFGVHAAFDRSIPFPEEGDEESLEKAKMEAVDKVVASIKSHKHWGQISTDSTSVCA